MASSAPSPITTVPSIAIASKALRMASIAATSVAISSPRPMSRAEASAAASVTRTSSMARLRSRPGDLGGWPGNHGGCGERSGGCERRARSSLLRRAFRHASSVVAALAALAPRLVRLAHHDYPDGLLAADQRHPAGDVHLEPLHGGQDVAVDHVVLGLEEADGELAGEVVEQLGLPRREAPVDADGAADQADGADRPAHDVEVAGLARPEVGRAEAERDAIHGSGEEERELAEGDGRAVDLDVGPRRLEDRPRAVGAAQRGEDQARQEPRCLEDTLLLARVVHAQEVDRRAEAQYEAVLRSVHAQQVALGGLVDAAPAVVADDSREDLLGAAAPPADRVRDVVDGAGAQRQEERQRRVAVHRAEAGEGAVVAPVAAADREHLRVLRAELARHVLDRRERLRHAHGTVPAHDLGQPPHALRTAVAVRPGVRIDDDADAGHARRLSGWS